MSVMDELLQRFNLTYDELYPVEKEQLNTWMEALQKNELTLAKVKGYIGAMRESLELELTKVGHESKQDLFMKARLRNYMLLDAFLTSPEKARQAIERSLMNIPTQIKKK